MYYATGCLYEYIRYTYLRTCTVLNYFRAHTCIQHIFSNSNLHYDQFRARNFNTNFIKNIRINKHEILAKYAKLVLNML